jgi:hypothetical protein
MGIFQPEAHRILPYFIQGEMDEDQNRILCKVKL